jgi:molecular chaperone DnaJ
MDGFEHSCRPCRGSGYYGTDPRDTCSVCRGRGKVYIAGEREDYQTCEPCRGSGYYGSDPHETCAVCNGWGIVTKVYGVTV